MGYNGWIIVATLPVPQQADQVRSARIQVKILTWWSNALSLRSIQQELFASQVSRISSGSLSRVSSLPAPIGGGYNADCRARYLSLWFSRHARTAANGATLNLLILTSS